MTSHLSFSAIFAKNGDFFSIRVKTNSNFAHKYLLVSKVQAHDYLRDDVYSSRIAGQRSREKYEEQTTNVANAPTT